MRYTKLDFFADFYGFEFARDYRRPSDFRNPTFRTQFTVTNPKKLYSHVHKNNGFHPSFVTTHDYITVDNLKHRKSANANFDRIYFDFDVDHPEAKSIKDKLKDLRSHGLNHEKDLQNELKKRLKSLVVDDEIAKPAIDEAKEFAMMFKNEFGKEPALFFSGFKGCHAYLFFNPIDLINPNKTVEHFAKSIKDIYKFDTMDLAVNKSTIGVLERVPYSKHQYTDLTVVPFSLTDSYGEIMRKSLNPVVEPFNIENYLTNLDEHLVKIDKILDHNHNIELEKKKEIINRLPKNRHFKNVDHREFFKDILGEPEGEYPEKEYVMYCCPFPDHEDNHPSFRVHKTGYLCYGCGKKGNYWQFLKDYHKWNDEQVKNHLKTSPQN